MIKNEYIDPPSSKVYVFKHNPAKLNGQIGVPNIVDRILGNILRKYLQKTLSFKIIFVNNITSTIYYISKYKLYIRRFNRR